MRPQDWIHIAPGAEPQLRRLGLDTVESALRCRAGRFAAMSSTSDTLEVLPPDGEPDAPSVYLKRYRYPTWSRRLKGMFRGALFRQSRAWFEYNRLSALRRQGVPCVEPLAVGERREAGFVTACMLITRGVPGQSLLSFAQSRTPVAPADRRRIIETLARQVRRMHDAGLVHGSLAWRDVLIRREENGGFAFAFLDPQRVRLYRLRGCRRLGFLHDVATLAATAMLVCSRADRLRFARAYFCRKRLNRHHRRWMNAVARRAQPLVARERHRMEVNKIFVDPGAVQSKSVRGGPHVHSEQEFEM